MNFDQQTAKWLTKPIIHLIGTLYTIFGSIYYGINILSDTIRFAFIDYLGITLFSFGVLIWSSLLFIYLKKKKNILIEVPSDAKTQIYRFNKKIRLVAIVLFFIIPLPIIAKFFLLLPIDNKLSENDIIHITVCTIDGKDHDYEITQFIVREMRKEFDTLNYVEITLLDTVIDERHGSLSVNELGKFHNSDIFIWGWYSKTNDNVAITINTEFLNPALQVYNKVPRYSHNEYLLPTSMLDSFDFQFIISEEINLFTLKTVAEVKFAERNYPAAELLFTKALNDSLINNIPPSKGALFIERSLCRKFIGDSTIINKSLYYVNALNDVDSGLSYFPEDYDILCHKLDLQMLLGELNDDYSMALITANKIITLNRENALSHYYLGIIYKSLQNYTLALKHFSRAITLAPALYEGYYNRGVTFFYNSEYSLAIKDFTTALSINPEGYPAYYMRSLCYKSIGDITSAEKDLHKLLSISPNHSSALNELANIYFLRNNIEDAMSIANKVISISSDWVERFLKYYILEDYKAYIKDDTTGIDVSKSKDFKFFKTYFVSDYIEANYILSQCYNELSQFKNALNSINICISYYPAAIQYRYYRSVIYINMNRIDSAIEDISNLIKSNRLDYGMYFVRATYFEKKGDYSSAIKDYKMVISLNANLYDTLMYNTALENILMLKKNYDY